MATYRISGVWKNSDDVITHYAIHTVNASSVSRAKKVPKTEAIRLLEIGGNSAKTWVWNYRESKWKIGEDVEVVNGYNGKYLRSNPNDISTDNLAHLIDFDWIYSN